MNLSTLSSLAPKFSALQYSRNVTHPENSVVEIQINPPLAKIRYGVVSVAENANGNLALFKDALDSKELRTFVEWLASVPSDRRLLVFKNDETVTDSFGPEGKAKTSQQARQELMDILKALPVKQDATPQKNSSYQKKSYKKTLIGLSAQARDNILNIIQSAIASGKVEIKGDSNINPKNRIIFNANA